MCDKICQTIPDWTADYVGLPFKAGGRDRCGLDCWGLLVTVLREQFGNVIPAYDGISFEEGCDRAALATFMETHKTDWIDVPTGQEQPGDGILLRMMGHPIHVAVVVANGWMLHIEEGIDACLERYDGAKWRKRVMGFYRYQDPGPRHQVRGAGAAGATRGKLR
ncbi:MAG: C40 family peptidase [Rhodospirillales bacterium]|nr:C40 family peptidase [Rhodospirillales bacterium]